MKQHITRPPADRPRWLTARRRERLRLALVLVACILFGSACATTTLVTQIVHQPGGENLIGQSMTIEFNKGVWDALKPDDHSQLATFLDSYKAKGWNVVKQEDGRVQTASFDPLSLADLQNKGWTFSVNNTGKGNITTAQWAPPDASSSSSGLQQLTVTIDETDPQTTHYKYQANVVVQFEDSSGKQTDSSGDGSPFGFLLAQAEATAEADSSYSNLKQALQDAGPARMGLSVNLPGTIDSTTINDSPGGSTSGSQVTWNLVWDKNATYTLVATSSDTATGSGSTGSGSSDAFVVSVACQPDMPGDTGQVVCVANSTNKPDGAEIEYEWKFDGQAQETRSNTLVVHGVAKGEHSVSVVAIATNQNNLRSQPGGATFTKTTGADSAAPTATTGSGGFTVSLACSVSDQNLICLASPRNAPADANLTYAWTSYGGNVTATGASATIATSGEGVYLITVTVTDSKSGKSASASTTAPIGTLADPGGTLWGKIPDDWKIKINAGLTGSGAITPPKPSDISAGAILGAVGSAALAGAAALGTAGSAPANAPGTPTNQQGQGSDGTETSKDDKQKGSKSKQLDFCTNEVNAMQAASSQAMGLQQQLQVQRSQMNTLQMQYQITRENSVILGGISIALLPVAIYEAVAGSMVASVGTGTAGGTLAAGSDLSTASLAEIRAQINGTQTYIGQLEGQFDSAMQALQNAKSALDACRALHPAPGGNM